MLLAYMTGFGESGNELGLCLVADKIDALTKPVRVESLFPNPAAVIRIGPEESCSVAIDKTDGSLVISSILPAAIYLTPNLAQTPGFKVRRIKIQSGESGPRVFYDRDKGSWEEWIANKERT